MRTSADTPSKRQKKRFVKITFDGASCICRPEEVKDMLDDSLTGHAISDTWMTEDEYEAMPEFQGW